MFRCFAIGFFFAFGFVFGAKTIVEVLEKAEKCEHKTQDGDLITWKYRGTQLDGEQFSEGTYTAVLGHNTMVKGIDQGMYGMCVGEKRRLEIPPELGYESQGTKNIYFFNELTELSRGGKVLASNLPPLKIEELDRKEKCDQRSQDGDTIFWHYKGTLEDGTIFDEGDYQAELDAGKIIQGVNDGMKDMCVGETRKLTVPPHLGYGEKGFGKSIPGGATLTFINRLDKIEAAWPAGHKIKLLKRSNFHDVLKSEAAALVMFYAPWCGHCKTAKPAYAEASKEVKQGVLAAVDCTKDGDLCKENGVNGYPTLKFYRNGKKSRDYNGGRTKSEFVSELETFATTISKTEL